MKETTGPSVFLQETIFCSSVRDISRGVCGVQAGSPGGCPLGAGAARRNSVYDPALVKLTDGLPINQIHMTLMQRPECNFLYLEEHSFSMKRSMSSAQGIPFLVSAYTGCQSAIRKLPSDAEIPAKGVLGLPCARLA